MDTNLTVFPARQVAGLPVSLARYSDAIQYLSSLRFGIGTGSDTHLINSYSIALTQESSDYKLCLSSATNNFPDGRPLGLLTKFSNQPLDHVRGPSLFEAVLEAGIPVGLRHFLLGGSPETLDRLADAIETKFPGIKLVGRNSPPFRALTDEELEVQDLQIRESEPDLVWVGLGTPKQDFEARRLRDTGFNAVAIGAAFDFTAGTKRSAPAWMTHLGVEWVFRLLSEPKRLWRRYLLGNTAFLLAVVKNRDRN